MYADYGYYTDGYLLGRSPAVPEAVFPYWEKQAERVRIASTHSAVWLPISGLLRTR